MDRTYISIWSKYACDKSSSELQDPIECDHNENISICKSLVFTSKYYLATITSLVTTDQKLPTILSKLATNFEKVIHEYVIH